MPEVAIQNGLIMKGRAQHAKLTLKVIITQVKLNLIKILSLIVRKCKQHTIGKKTNKFSAFVVTLLV